MSLEERSADLRQRLLVGALTDVRKPTIAALAAMKDKLDEAPQIDFAEALDREAERMVRASTTADHTEAVRAFMEKRKPRFTGT